MRGEVGQLMQFVGNGIVPPFIHISADVLDRSHPGDLRAVGLPQRRISRPSALLVFHDLVQPFLVEIEDAEPHAFGLDWTSGVRIDKCALILFRMASAVAVLPEIGEFGLLSSDAPDGAFRAQFSPPISSQSAQLGKCRMYSRTHDLAPAQAYLVDPVWLSSISVIAHVIDQEHAYLGQSQECLSGLLLHQMRRGHD